MTQPKKKEVAPARRKGRADKKKRQDDSDEEEAADSVTSIDTEVTYILTYWLSLQELEKLVATVIQDPEELVPVVARYLTE